MWIHRRVDLTHEATNRSSHRKLIYCNTHEGTHESTRESMVDKGYHLTPLLVITPLSSCRFFPLFAFIPPLLLLFLHHSSLHNTSYMLISTQ